MSNFQINIDELVLNGFPPEHQDEIRGALRDELARLARGQDASTITRNNGDIPARIEATQGSPRDVGIQAARNIHARFSR